MKKFKLLFYAASVAVFLGSCTGKNGAPGATGPQGNANVQSAAFTVTSWGYNSPSYYVTLSVPALTASINSSGAVDVYMSFDNGTTWNTVPYDYYQAGGDYLATDYYTTGVVTVNWTYNVSTSTGSDPNSVFSTSTQIKVVCVAPSIIKANPNVNWKNYNEVQRTFNLKD
ncbi:MAG TPA: hypothetical protein VNG53_04420 [Bacteroidia bacterium]|nr:hypothetical protein [Bacteroidia bacterium]